MAWFKKLTDEEKQEKKLSRIKISLKNLYVVRIGCTSFSRHNRNELFYSNGYTLAKFHQRDSSDWSYYEDIFSHSKLYLFGSYKIPIGGACCNNPIPFISILNECDLKYEILRDGYITKYQASIFMEGINKQINESVDDTNIEDKLNNTSKSSSKPKEKKLTEGKVLNDKVYSHEPAIGREQELKSIITTLASQKKSPILVGPSGTGKTTIVDELVYKIQRDEVPDFLKGKQVVELDTSSIVAGTKYVGTLEEKFKKIINYASSNDALLFIDEIHTIYGAGATSKDDNDIAEMLKKAIDRENIRVIGTTTNEEYEEYFSKDALKRRFEPTMVKEPTNDILTTITNKVFFDYSSDSNISLDEINDKLDDIIETLIKMTQPASRNHFDKVCNPDLIISIIDKAFADARINDQSNLTINNIIYGVNTCNRIYESVREKYINKLNELKPKVKKIGSPKSEIIPFRK